MQMPMLLLSLTVLGPLVFSQAQAKVLPGRAGKFFDWEALPPAQYVVSSLIILSLHALLFALHH